MHVVVLAAGKSVRMRATLPKVLHEVGGQPMLAHVMAAARTLRPTKIHVVVAKQAAAVRRLVLGRNVSCVVQLTRNGTASATQVACAKIPAHAVVLVLFGDLPLLRPAALSQLVAVARRNGVGVRTMKPPVTTGYSRVVRDADDNFVRLVTEVTATAAEKMLCEVDAGGMSFPAGWGKVALAKIKPQAKDREIVLTGLVALAHADGMPVKTVLVDAEDGMGVNTPGQLLAVKATWSRRCVARLAAAGVLFADPATVAIRGKVVARPGAFVDRNVVFSGEVRLAEDSCVGPNCVVTDTTLAAGACLHAFTHAEGADLGQGAQAGPFARLRPGTKLGQNAKVGNFVETKATKLGAGAKANHLAYLGDGQVGPGANIGAGTVFCNYDGHAKHPTKVGDHAFIGSGSMLVAPIEVGAGALVAAGSVITKDVPAGALAVGRSKQCNLTKRSRKAAKPSKQAS